jgi:hypothetical protein
MSTELPFGTTVWVSRAYQLSLDEPSVRLELRGELDASFSAEFLFEPLLDALALQLVEFHVHARAFRSGGCWSWGRSRDRGGLG